MIFLEKKTSAIPVQFVYQTTRANCENNQKMFYVVYLTAFNKYIVISSAWLRHDGEMIQKFMRSGINPIQTHLCFYKDAVVNVFESNEICQPNFDLPMATTYPCAEGIYHCRIAGFFGKFTRIKIIIFPIFLHQSCCVRYVVCGCCSTIPTFLIASFFVRIRFVIFFNLIFVCIVEYQKAAQHAESRRELMPLVFNENRVSEQPIPNVEIERSNFWLCKKMTTTTMSTHWMIPSRF